ncbi:unnamed protein product [Cyprideis torosa]|uniref:Uncharacterized protein n=1 Tax=Cyprideis torosa TaxID=163714 RepID=A0A7R8ZMK0_9CRUS|nr:unnamed protein product [Cyprideis torosa]CAG0894397.1 unnamed protein product [Cyprideis torosa]
MAHHRVQSAGPHESKLCCYCGQNGVFLVAWMWITFSLVVIAACSYWLWLVNNHDGNRYRSTDPVLGGTADFYSFSTDTLRILLGCFIGDTILNCLVSFILLYGAYEVNIQFPFFISSGYPSHEASHLMRLPIS